MTDRLRTHPLFEGLADERLDPLASYAMFEEFDAGEKLLRADGIADTLRLILEGRVALFLNEGPRATPFETLGPGDAVGVSWLRPGGRWAFTAVAWTYVTTIAISASALHTAMNEDPELRHRLNEALNRVLVSRLHSVRLQHLDLYGSPHAHR